ncbi:sugar transferase [Marinoscillum sp. 108]|uniref:sugar transferase n=1 Tax=Marinoscillum sp. 108 TaxID=2653151 RepID=UPI0013568C97|nr:sugar transferase [Marinoscillum sp. 108]
MSRHSKYFRYIKPSFDFLMAGWLCIVLLPLMCAIALWLLLSGQPVFFVQERPGLGGRLFKMLKFTTMTNVPGDPIFPMGKFLRKTSLDELPQLFNILKGEMSFIGPRPLLVAYLQKYTPKEHRRHEVKPGITGWAQVNGRNALDFKEKMKLDLYYVAHCSLWLDLRIFLKTFVQLIKWWESDYHAVQVKTSESH